MNWKSLVDLQQIEEIEQESFSPSRIVLIFKHSTRCSISSMAKDRLERFSDWNEEIISPYYLDLIQYRSISDAIVTKWGIEHESPQVLLIVDGKCTYSASHYAVDPIQVQSEWAALRSTA